MPIIIKIIPKKIDIAKKEFNKNLWNRRVLSYFNIINLILKLISIYHLISYPLKLSEIWGYFPIL